MKYRLALCLPLGAALALVLWQFTPVNGHMGHDFYHYFARIHLGAVHFWQNGWAVPHYTPSLCGGLPFFADPQSMYYSVPQFLSFFLDPLAAVLLTHLVFHALGYWGFWRLLRWLEVPAAVSHLGALLFILNGFTFAHLLVGHMTHHSYLLFPWLLYFPLRAGAPGVPFLRESAIFSLAVIYTFYSGGTHMIVVFSAGGLLLAPWLVYRQSRLGRLGRTAGFLAVSAAFVLLACSPKLAASAQLAPAFLKRPVDASGLSLVTLLKQYFWFDRESTPHTIRFGLWHFGPWEFVGFVSVILAPVVPWCLLRALVRPDRTRLTMTLVYFAVIYAIAWVGAARHAEMGIPWLREYHNPIKIYGAFIPFLILGFAFILKQAAADWPRLVPVTPWVKVTLFGVTALTLLVEFYFNSDFFVRNRLVYGYQYGPGIYRELKARGSLPPVRRVTEAYGSDVKGIAEGATSRHCFEPMFGYRREVMRATVEPGPTDAIRDGAFNLTHPGCLVYPDHFKCRRWDRIAESDRENFDKFVRGEPTDWGVPPWQKALLTLGGTVIALLAAVAVGLPRWRPVRLGKPAEVPA